METRFEKFVTGFTGFVLALALTSCGKDGDESKTFSYGGAVFREVPTGMEEDVKRAWKVATKAVRPYEWKGSSIRVRLGGEGKGRVIADQTFHGSSLIRVYNDDHRSLVSILAHELAHAILHSNEVYGHDKRYDGKGLYNWKGTRHYYNEK